MFTKKIKDSYADYLLLLIAAFLWIFEIWHNYYGFNLADEAWYLLALNPKQELGLVPTESFCIIRFLLKFFPNSIISLRLLGLVFIFIGTLVFSMASYFWLKKHNEHPQNKMAIFSIFMILGAAAYVGRLYMLTLHYNQLQTFFVLAIISLFLLSDVFREKKKIALFMILLGFFSFFSVINIAPSGIFVTLAIFILLLVKHWKNKILALKNFLYILFGIILATLFYHLCIRSIADVARDFFLLSQTVTKVAGYSNSDFLILIQEYLAEIFYVLFFSSVVILFFNQYIGRVKSCWILFVVVTVLFLFSLAVRRDVQGIVLSIPLVIAYLWNKSHFSGHFSKSNILFLLIIFLPIYIPLSSKMLLFYILTGVVVLFFALKYERKISTQELYPKLLFTFLLLLPFVASVGTNIAIKYKMIMFLPFWGFLFCGLLCRHSKKEANWLKMVFVIFFLAFYSLTFIQKSYFDGSILNSHFSTNLKNLQAINLTESQKLHFESVDVILKENGYVPGDEIFAFYSSLGTVYAVDGILHLSLADSYAVERFFILNSDEKKINKPRFMILYEDKINFLSSFFLNQGWNISEDYKKFAVLSHRGETVFVYCLKND